MKKLSVAAIIIAAVCLLASSSAFAQNDAVHSAELITKLNIMTKEDMYSEDVLTRAEFITCCMNLYGKDASLTGQEPEFTDVSKADYAYSDISAAYMLGFVSGYSDGSFGPNNPIMPYDAAVIMLRVLGYSDGMKLLSDADIIRLAGKTGLSDGVSLNKTAPLDRADAVRLIYNTLHANTANQKYISNEKTVLTSDENTTLLERNFDISFTDGTVTSTGNAATDGEKAGKTLARINGILIKDSAGQAVNMLGSRVRCYYKNGSDNALVLIYEKNNDIKNASLSDTAYENRTFSITEKGKTTDFAINSDTSVFINNCLVGNENEIKNSLTGFGGSIKLVDNNRDGTYETALITRFKNIIVGSFNSADNVIISKFNSSDSYSLEDYDAYHVYDSQMTETDTDSITAESLISVLEPLSKDGELRIVLGSETVSKKVDMFDAEENIFTSDGEEFKISASSSIAPVTCGETYRFYMDFCGEAAYSENLNERMIFVYAISAGKEKGISSKAELKVFGTDNKTVVYKTSDRIKLRGPDGSFMSSKLNGSELLKYLENNGLAKKAPLMIRLNSDEEITEVWTLTDNQSVAFHKLSDDLKPTKMYEYRNNNFSARYVGTKSTVYMRVPMNESSDENDYSVTGQGLFTNSVSYYIKKPDISPRILATFISLKEDGFLTDICVVEYDYERFSTIREAVDYGILTKIKHGTNADGEDICLITQQTNTGEEVTYEYIDDGRGVYDGQNGLAANLGDIIRVAPDERGKITSSTFKVAYSCRADRFLTYITGSAKRYCPAIRFMPIYEVLAKQDGFIKFKSYGNALNEADTSGIETEEIMNISGAKVYEYDMTANKLRECGTNAVEVSDYPDANVFAASAYGVGKMIIFYK